MLFNTHSAQDRPTESDPALMSTEPQGEDMHQVPVLYKRSTPGALYVCSAMPAE